MQPATLDDFMALNDQLAALVQAGVPFNTGLGLADADTGAALQKINASVARRVSQGASLTAALESDELAAPAAYRCLMQLALRSGDFSGALAGNRQLTESVGETGRAARSNLLYPLIVCGVAYLGLVGLCLFFVPRLQDLWLDLQLRPGLAMRTLSILRETMAFWAPLPPLALLCWLGWQWRNRVTRQAPFSRANEAGSWLSVPPRAITLLRWASFAESLAILLDRNVPLDEGLRIAAGACGDATLAAGARSLADCVKSGTMLSDNSSAALQFPPFLRWALWHSEATTGRARALRMAGSMYAGAAKESAERWRIAAPILVCAVLGGGVTLLYGLALFLPVVEMLKQLAP